MKQLPKKYQIMPYSIDFKIPGFLKQHIRKNPLTLSPEKIDCEAWFYIFSQRIYEAISTSYLPICRMSDGEFRFMFGDQPPSPRRPFYYRVKLKTQRLFLSKRKDFRATTTAGVSSGSYDSEEWLSARIKYSNMLVKIARKGILALHLNYNEIPFQEDYFPALGEWLKRNEIRLTSKNCGLNYFVYALLTGPEKSKFFKNRKILVVHSAKGIKRRHIEESLYKEGIDELYWCSISRERSLYDKIDIMRFKDKVDIAFIGAGIGKPNILLQLEPLKIPCLDCGYLFEVWADEEKKWQRPFCVPDDSMILARFNLLEMRK